MSAGKRTRREQSAAPQEQVSNNLAETKSRFGKQEGRFSKATCKQRGELAEMMFMVKASTKGLVVSKPYGDSNRYDFIVDSCQRTWRVQVKSTASTRLHGYRVSVHWNAYRKHVPYQPSDVDFLAVLITGTDVWYVIPTRALRGRLMIRVFPFGGRSRGSPRLERYREAWHLLQPQTKPRPRA
jgi:hypothetical protein